LERMATQLQSGLSLLPKDSLQPLRRRFPGFQAVTHCQSLLSRQLHIAVPLFPCHFSAKPPRWLELAGGGLTWEFHFRDDEAGISTTISIDLDDQILPWDFVAELAQSPASRCWPQRGELFRTQLDL